MKLLSHNLLGKLLLITGGGTCVLLVAVVYAFWHNIVHLHSYSVLLNGPVAQERAVLHIEADFKKQVQEWKDTLIRGSDPAALDKYWQQFEQREAAVDKETQALIGQLPDGEARQLLQQFMSAHQTMGAAYRKGLEQFKSSGFVTQVGDKAVKGIDREPTTTLDQAAAVIAKSVTVRSGAMTRSARADLELSALFIVIAVIIAFAAFLWAIKRMILTPADGLVRDMERLSGGDFAHPIAVHSEDEIGQLAASAEQLRTILRVALQQVAQSATQLASESAQLSAVSEGTTEGVTTQQRETDMVATAINEMTATVAEVARSAANAADAAAKADHEASDGKRLVTVTIDQIDALATEIEHTADTINTLAADSDNISGVLDVIRGIAEQTNLLALNAAIEAARAGEQGRGFAVVADEVRTLASRTQQSTREIQGMIEKLQSGTRNAVEAMKQNRGHAQETVTQAAQAGAALDGITAAVTRINEMNTQIASAAEEQGAVAEEINRNVSNISQVAETSAHGAQQITHASGELSQLAHQLQQMIGRFQL